MTSSFSLSLGFWGCPANSGKTSTRATRVFLVIAQAIVTRRACGVTWGPVRRRCGSLALITS